MLHVSSSRLLKKDSKVVLLTRPTWNLLLQSHSSHLHLCHISGDYHTLLVLCFYIETAISVYLLVICKDMALKYLLLSWSSCDVWAKIVGQEKAHRRSTNFTLKHPRLQPRMRSIVLDWLMEAGLHLVTLFRLNLNKPQNTTTEYDNLD